MSFQATPLQIADAIYFCTGYNDVIALDAETGREIWRRSLDVDLADVAGLTCRGVSYYRIPETSGVCAERIITATLDARLIALDRRTGELCMGFGHHGAVSLLEGMGPVTKGYYYVTSPPAIVRGRIVLGGWVTDGQYWGEPSGVIRAFDAVNGRLAWAFDVGQPDQTGLPAPGEHYTRATPNSWAPMSADEAMGMVYVPTGNATPDYFGGQRRPFDDAYSSSVVAIDVATGRPRWTFQTTHHDLWDYDVASQPTLVDLRVNGTVRRLLLQPTKRGELFVLDRVTGQPAFPIVEYPVPAHGYAPGERLAATQPFSPALPAFSGPELTEDSMWGLTPIDELWCRLRFREARYEGVFTPPGLTPYIQYPGYLGGFGWGSVSVDPARRIAVFNTSRMANHNQLLSRAEAESRGIRARRAGSTEFVGGAAAQEGTPFAADIRPFLSPLGVPCQAPPYSMLSAIDLSSGKLLWHQPLGTARDAGPWSLKLGLPLPMGSPSLGGATTTASGITFIAATQDRYLRAFDSRTGKQLWRSRLPAGGHAVPMTYLTPQTRRQVVIIAAGGSSLLKSKAGNHLLAYALPMDDPRTPADRPH
ncbi:hypothetical protein ACG33_10700 [Steroidobacter denitrificans]|uniref:Pyrrolo-quinoline quinone repeat domain-containing protein n=1 Tax=Steroidobacter denitrificans TaxID=465721 RepID=A0A127FAV9_STEDE|nr:pyrroloquinoline quinone-dependent dehydrogenase [Steroidobacter denitrificans]AMN47557.1 hypothetical protein ACG33_10700 [Steroidobacter denitrificans]